MHNKTITIPAFARPLLQEKKRYKVMWGGRGGGKSYSAIDSILALAVSEKIGVLCGREIQKSLKESVHALLRLRIQNWELDDYFKITQDRIESTSGSFFLFAGLSQNIESIKSIPGLTHMLIEEGATISARSWELIDPTIREEGSEIWIIMNPERESDILYKTFIANNHDDAIVIKVNYYDNPFFPEVLEKVRERAEATLNRDTYNHIWLGDCRKITDAQIFKNKFFVEEFTPDYTFNDPLFGMDFGFSEDPFAVVKLYVKEDELYIHKECYIRHLELDDISAYTKNAMPDIARHVIRADNARPDTISYLQRNGLPLIESVEKGKGSIEDGIAFMRSFKRIIIHPDCPNVLNEFELYSYKVDSRTGDISAIIVDAYNHTIDSIRYALRPLSKSTEVDYGSLL